VRGAIERAPELPEWDDKAFLAREKWDSWHASLLAAHARNQSRTGADLAGASSTAFDELLANQLALALNARQKRQRGLPVAGDGRLRKACALPFDLTASQRPLDEISPTWRRTP
jgi:ATP-dependent DNA helicase RecG